MTERTVATDSSPVQEQLSRRELLKRSGVVIGSAGTVLAITGGVGFYQTNQEMQNIRDNVRQNSSETSLQEIQREVEIALREKKLYRNQLISSLLSLFGVLFFASGIFTYEEAKKHSAASNS